MSPNRSSSEELKRGAIFDSSTRLLSLLIMLLMLSLLLSLWMGASAFLGIEEDADDGCITYLLLLLLLSPLLQALLLLLSTLRRPEEGLPLEDGLALITKAVAAVVVAEAEVLLWRIVLPGEEGEVDEEEEEEEEAEGAVLTVAAAASVLLLFLCALLLLLLLLVAVFLSPSAVLGRMIASCAVTIDWRREG
jgi:hypothetical protein